MQKWWPKHLDWVTGEFYSFCQDDSNGNYEFKIHFYISLQRLLKISDDSSSWSKDIVHI